MTACIVLALVGGVVYLALSGWSSAGMPGRAPLVELARLVFFVGLFWLGYLLAGGHALHLP